MCVSANINHISLHKPNLYDYIYICTYTPLSLSLYIYRDQTYKTMYHTHDHSLHFGETFPGKDQSIKVWSSASCELVWDPHSPAIGAEGRGLMIPWILMVEPVKGLGPPPKKNGDCFLDLPIEK